jgi:hypothetical protein
MGSNGTDGTQSSTTWTYWSGNNYVSQAQVAANIASTINTNGTLSGQVWAVPSSVEDSFTVYSQAAGASSYAFTESGFSALTVSSSTLTGSESLTAGLQNEEWFPLTYFYSATQGQCDNDSPSADYVAFNTGVAGSANQPTIIAYDNLYSGCASGNVPSPYWQYNTGTGYTISTSPVVSFDGTQVAFVQTNGTSNAAQLVILRWAKNPALVQLTSDSSYVSTTGNCTAPCMIAISFADGHYDTTSSPFYDYASDTIYVGDTELTGGANSEGQGYLHKFTNVFNIANGTTPPAEVTSTWPVLISSSNAVASPLYDDYSGQAIIGVTGIPACSGQTNCGGRLHEVSGSTGAPTTNSTLTLNGGNTGQTDAPILDPVAGYAYVFTSDDTAGNAGVWQYHVDNTTDFQVAPVEKVIGQGNTTSNQFTGAFDNLYYSGAATGHLYVCGRATGSQDSTIWQIPITVSTNALGTPAAGPALTTAATSCSAVTEYYNGTTDYIFLSVQNDAADSTPVPCTGGGGCIISFNVTSGAAITSTTTANSANAITGGTGGLVVDNAFTTPGGEGNVYFFPLATQTCTGPTTGAPVGEGSGTCGIQALQTSP